MRSPDAAESLLQSICKGSTDAAGEPPVAIHAAASDSFQRCLVTARACMAGSSVLAVPWPHALTAEGSMQQLRHYEAHGRGLLPRGIASVAELFQDADSDLLPKASAWVLLLALHLLCQLRDPRSRWAKYVKLLPAPPASRISAVCSAGPPATDLLLFSTEELGCLGSPALALAVGRERLRLTRLHAHLFMQQSHSGAAKEPEISLESFIWAHCLVCSRALELTADKAAGTAFHERCMLPVIDLCNHDGVHATCWLSMRLTPAGEPRAVDLIATRDLEAGAELTLDYGSRPMRDMLRGYGFTPVHAAFSDPSEVYEEIGEACETLSVQGSGKGSLFQLREIKVLGAPGAHTLLEQAGQATICYVVQDEAIVGADNWHEAPRLSLEMSSASQTIKAALYEDRQLPQDEGDIPGISFGGSSAPTLPPDAERASLS
ncbi:g4113 [Coccomyxa viridis]|uniref:G4113 protein n=1 Tax=Coccomyxa viridis TaxID=1274662 RepID=A0ABP1FWD0_9CHLO